MGNMSWAHMWKAYGMGDSATKAAADLMSWCFWYFGGVHIPAIYPCFQSPPRCREALGVRAYRAYHKLNRMFISLYYRSCCMQFLTSG